MHLAFFTAAALSLVSVTRAVSTHMPDCVGGPWMPEVPTGDGWSNTPDYQHFCEAGWSDGDILTGIKIWRAEWQIHAIQLRWGTHDYGRIYGIPEDPNKPDATSEWGTSDNVLIRLWNNRPDDGARIDALGRIRVEVDGKDPVEVSVKKVGKEVKFDQGSRKILAAVGAHGAWVSTLQFTYLESSVVDTTITSITFTDSMDKYNSEHLGLTDAYVGDLYIKNSNPEGGLNQTYSMTPKLERSISKTITTQMTHSLGGSLSMKVGETVGVPGVASVSVDVTAEAHYEFSYMENQALTNTAVWSFPWTVGSTAQGIPPQTAAHCTAWAVQGDYNSAYTAKVTARLDNGKTFTYNDAGQFHSLQYTQAVSDCKTIPLKDVPKGQGEEANNQIPSTNAVVATKAKRAFQFRA